MKKIGELSKKYFDSWISIFSLSLIMVIVAFAQILLFVFSDGSISGFESQDKEAWVTYIYLFTAFPFGISMIFSFILSTRHDQRYFYFAFIVEISYCISGIAGGMMMTTLSIICMIFINITRYTLIRKHGDNYKLDDKLVYIILAIGIFIFITVGVLSIELDDNNVFWWNTNVYGDVHPNLIKYADLLSSLFLVAGGILLLSANKHAFIMWIVCDVLLLILFNNAHQWSNVVLTLVNILMESLAYFAWNYEKTLEVKN